MNLIWLSHLNKKADKAIYTNKKWNTKVDKKPNIITDKVINTNKEKNTILSEKLNTTANEAINTNKKSKKLKK